MTENDYSGVGTTQETEDINIYRNDEREILSPLIGI